MKKLRRYLVFCFLFVICTAVTACGGSPAETSGTEETKLSDGVYSAEFDTDGSMFHVNEAYDGKGILTVKDGKMTIHVTLPSKNTVNLFRGTAEDAQKEGADLLMPTLDTVSYGDGTRDEVYGFDIPVPYIGKEFDCALVGKKGKWYDHKVIVSDPVRIIDDGEYTVEVRLSGGSGKASVTSPAKITVAEGQITAEIVWSSPNYEYMTLDGTRYDRVNTEGNSTFIIPVVLDREISVSALTTAMSEPHLIDYTLFFDGTTVK